MVWTLVLLLPTISGRLSECLEGLFHVMTSTATVFPTNTYEAMAVYSGKWLNDLGNYEACAAIPEANYVLLSMQYQGPFLGVGLCGPAVCTSKDYVEILGNLTAPSPLQRILESAALLLPASSVPVSVTFPSEHQAETWSSGAVCMLLLCLGLLLCVAVGSYLDLTRSSETGDLEAARESSSALQVLFCFSLCRTIPEVFRPAKRRDGLGALDGVRVLSMLSVVSGHLLMVRVLGSVTANPQDFTPFFKSRRAAVIYSAHFAVDTFFWLSGFLLALVFLQKSESSQSPGIFRTYAHRFLRLGPVYMFVLFLTWSISPYVGTGPRGFHVDDINEHCSSYWWASVFFIHNQVPDWLGVGCLGQSWYLATDMQIFWALVPVLVLYHRRRRAGWICLCAICGVSVFTSGYIAWRYNFSVIMKSPQNTEHHYSSRYYVQPYTRSGPYVLGVMCAMLYYSHCVYKSSREVYDDTALALVRLVERRRVRVCAFVGALALGLFLVFIQCDAYQALDDDSKAWSRSANSLFIGTYRLLWGLCLSAVLLPLVMGLSPPCERLLSLSLWTPLSRLTFSAYLVHAHITVATAISQEAAVWFGDLSMWVDFCFVTLLTFLFALPVALAVEIPINFLTRLRESAPRKLVEVS